MGVPKFFMYMSERYPCLSELAREQCIPEFDNLYLDMNGIIHNCSHPDDNNFSFSLAEQDMFKDIFNYIDKLFFLIRPQKLFMLAVDGVAPRAKMNQQRSRRFRSAKEAEQLEEKAKQKGLKREDERFDSNCITPGTEFMQRLQTALRYFIKNKLSNDPLWQKCRIILSGHETPGEGEHKIMDYIRYMKSQPDYDPNTRHCLYGLDADLIILGLCTHELHFVVLREEVKFGKKTKHVSVEETRFFLLHLGLFREYLELEFNEIRLATGSLDIARLIDDWVLMSFLVGNDFVPHLPCLHISSNALPLLYKTYINIYPTLGGNINENGKLNLERLEKFFAALTDVEFEIFKDNHADLVYFDSKCSKNGVHEAFDFDVADINNTNPNDELAELIENSRKMMEGDDDEDLSDEEGHLNAEFETYKRDYYRTKLHKDSTQLEVRREQAVSYVTALQWILDYYYRGVQSWNWYYPYHYAPFISDLHDFKDCKIQFDMGKPFLPFEQLLAVLPAASKKLLPAAYHDLMTSEHSAIIEFYPQRFDTDLNGKKHEWEAVVLIPFIDEQLLLEAMRACEKNLTADEANRNKHGPMLQYDHTEEDQGQWPGVATMKPLYHVFCTEKTIWARDIAISTSRSWCVELPNASRTVFFPGFPTMKHLKFKFELKTSRVKVFDRPSRNNTMVLMPEIRQGYDNLFTVAEKHLNQTVYIGWPHLVKAKVVAISDAKKYIDSDGIKDHDDRTHKLLVRTAEEHLMNRMGIDVEDFSVMVHVKIFTGSILTFNTKGKATSLESWSPTTTAVPASILVSEIVVHKDGKEKPKKTEDILKADTKVFFLGQPHYASEGTIIDPKLVNECGRVQVSITSPPEPDFREARRTQRECESIYMNSYNTAAQLGLPNNCVSRITGSVLVIPGVRRRMQPENISKTNIGLQLRFPRFNEERIGYTRRINQNWLYSGKAIDLIMDYYDKFPQVFDALSRCSEENFFESDIFPNNVGENRLEEIAAWLKEQEYQKASVIACGSKTVEPEAALKIFEAVEEMKKLPVRTLKLQVKPHLLLIPNLTHPDAYKSKSPVRLFDRVVIVKDTYMVPIGSKGTVVGIFPVSDPNPVRLECVSAVDYFYDILFDKDMPNGTDIHGVADQRVVKVPQASLLLVFTQQNGDSAAEAPHQKSSQTRALPQEQPSNENWRQPNNGNNNNNKNNGNGNQRPQQNHSSSNNANNNNNSNNKQAVFENEKPSTSKNSAQVPASGQVDIKTLLFEASKRAPLPPMPQFMTANGPGPGPKPASDDFWTPNANVVRKHAQPPQQQQQASLQQQSTQRQAPPQQQQQQQAQQRVPRQPAAMPQFGPPIQTQIFGKRPFVPAGQGQAGNDETAMLKNMLGLSVNDGSSPNKSVQLPQPPQCWRSDAQRSQMRNANDVPQPVTVLPFGPPLIQPPMHHGMAYAYFGGKCVPLPAGQPMPLQMPQMMPPPGVPSHQPMPHQPMSPQAMPHPGLPQQQPMPPQPMPTGEQSFSPDSLVQKGAFIPLQAMRQPRSQGGNAPSSSNHTKHDGPRAKDHGHHAQQQAPRQKPHRQQQTANAKEVPPQENAPRDSQPERPPAQKQPQPESTQSAVKKQVRTSKIGARFDNMP